MKNKYVFVAVMLCAILAAGMGFTSIYASRSGNDKEEKAVTIVTSFYPMYIAAVNIVQDTPGVLLKNLSEPQSGCLHDFQLTPEDMRLLNTADIFLINGGGIESFMQDVAASYPDLTVIEACAYIELLQDGEESNAHAWMSISEYRGMVQAIALELGEADPARAESYRENAARYDAKLAVLAERETAVAEKAKGTPVILFHEAFDYVARDCGMSVSLIMDLDEERQISAGETALVVAAAQKEPAPLILAEERYGKKMAETVQEEADVTVLYLESLNRGDYDPDSYLTGMEHNLELLEAYYGILKGFPCEK